MALSGVLQALWAISGLDDRRPHSVRSGNIQSLWVLRHLLGNIKRFWAEVAKALFKVGLYAPYRLGCTGGQTTEMDALPHEIGRPHATLITTGNVHDLEWARRLLEYGHLAKSLLAVTRSH